MDRDDRASLCCGSAGLPVCGATVGSRGWVSRVGVVSTQGDAPGGVGVVAARDPHLGGATPHVWWLAGGSGLAEVDGDDFARHAVHGPLHEVGSAWSDDLITAVRSAAVAATVGMRDLAAVPFAVTADGLVTGTPTRCVRTPLASVRVAVALHDDSTVGLSPAEAVRLVSAADIAAMLHPHHSSDPVQLVARGMGTSPGTGVGRLCCSAEVALTVAARGEPVVLAMDTTTLADEPAMRVASAVVTIGGGLTSHAAVLARAWGIPALCSMALPAGAASQQGAVTVRAGGLVAADGSVVVAEGTLVTVDGTAGQLFVGDGGVPEVVAPAELDVLLGWADRLRAGRVRILANADTPAEVALARDFGAEGIGLCRTEHHFVGDRVDLVRAVLAADTPQTEVAALEALGDAQRSDFVAVLAAAGDMAVTFRLLDPPLHEFLPSLEELLTARATGVLPDEALDGLAAARRWREHNPMLGTRGVRLAVMRSGLYRAQSRALALAVAERRAGGADPRVRILLPLVATAAEFTAVASWVRSAYADALADATGTPGDVAVGVMVETPRAALVAAELAPQADFLSFGTNDLTQLTFGFSRDDLSGMIERYVADGLLDHDPFATLDPHGVGRLMSTAIVEARAVCAGLDIGVCGEHAGDPASVTQLVAMGVDSLSCSAYRVQVARMAAAHAVLAGT
jgi:pyruvate,orthophosphate dikinase